MMNYAEIEPFGSVENDYQHGRIAHTVSNMAGKFYKDNPPKLKQFLRPPVLTKAQENKMEMAQARYLELVLEQNSRRAKNG